MAVSPGWQKIALLVIWPLIMPQPIPITTQPRFQRPVQIAIPQIRVGNRPHSPFIIPTMHWPVNMPQLVAISVITGITIRHRLPVSVAIWMITTRPTTHLTRRNSSPPTASRAILQPHGYPLLSIMITNISPSIQDIMPASGRFAQIVTLPQPITSFSVV